MSSLQAQNITWDDGGDGESWFDPLNWNPNVVPGKTNDVIIDIPGLVLIESLVDTAFANSIKLDGSGIKLGLAGGLLIIESTNTTTYGVLMQGDPSFTASGRMYINKCYSDGIRMEGGNFSITENDSLKIMGVAHNANGQGIDIRVGGYMQNDGFVSISGAGENNFEDGIVSEGGFNNKSTGTLVIHDIEGNSSSNGIEINNSDLTNDGEIYIDSIEKGSGISVSGGSSELRNYGGTITIEHILSSARSGVAISGGATLIGFGVLNSAKVSVASPGSKISPGPSTRKITINGDLTMGLEAQFILEIAGNAGAGLSGGHDLVEVNGDLILDNNDDILDVNLLGGYSPPYVGRYTFIEYSGSLGGTFLQMNIQGHSNLWTATAESGRYDYHVKCANNNTLICPDPSCAIYSTTFKNESFTIMNGPHLIPSGEEVTLSAPNVTLNAGFSVEAGAIFEILQTGCTP